MSTVKTTVEPGVCRMTAVITASCQDGMTATVQIESPCEKVGKFAPMVEQVEAYSELGRNLDTPIYRAMSECMYGGCTNCIVPAAVSKSVQIAAGLALVHDASIQFEKVEDAG